MADKNKQACDMLGKALEMEEKGKKFYDKAAAECKNEECRRVFQTLAGDEVVHIERINVLFDALSSGEAWCDDWEDMETKPDKLKEIFKHMAKEHLSKVGDYSGDIEALDTGIEFEAEGIKYYKSNLETAQDPVEKEFLEKMVQEERGHYTALNDMKFYLTNPEGWFREKEKGLLDGA